MAEGERIRIVGGAGFRYQCRDCGSTFRFAPVVSRLHKALGESSGSKGIAQSSDAPVSSSHGVLLKSPPLRIEVSAGPAEIQAGGWLWRMQQHGISEAG